MWEIFTLGGNPYPSVPVERLFELLKEGHRIGRPPYASEIINKTMQSCWHENPSGRPSFNNLVIDFNKMLTSMDNRSEVSIYSIIMELSEKINSQNGFFYKFI